MENVSDVKNVVLAVLAAIGSFIANTLGGWDSAMMLLAALMIADYVTGVAVAAIWHKSGKTPSGTLSSLAGFKGLVKKMAILLMVWIAVLLDNALNTSYVRVMVILFFTGNEGISLLENLGLMGVPFPDFLQKMLEALRDEGNSGHEPVNGREEGQDHDGT